MSQLDKAGVGREGQMAELRQHKDAEQAKLAGLEQNLRQLQNQAMQDGQRDAARRMQEAAATIEREGIKSMIEYSKMMMTGGSQAAAPIENAIGEDLATLRNRVADAAGAMDKAQQAGQNDQKMQNMARDLVTTMQSQQQQLQRPAGSTGSAGPGPAGREGRQGSGPRPAR